MSMLPIDMSITVQRTAEVNRLPTGEAAARPEMAQDEFAERFNREVRQQEQQINQSNKTEENLVNRDGRGNNSYNGQKKKKNTKDTKQQPGKAKNSGSLFDISI
jgi:hypothetical protein